MWKRKRCKVYSINVHRKTPKITISTISGRVWPMRTDMEMQQHTTGSHITGIAHHTVRVRNWVTEIQVKIRECILRPQKVDTKTKWSNTWIYLYIHAWVNWNKMHLKNTSPVPWRLPHSIILVQALDTLAKNCQFH